MSEIKVDIKKYVPDQPELQKRNDKLKKACKDFESILTYELLKSMRRTIDKTALFHGNGREAEMYEALFDRELSKSMAGNGSRSIASILYEQLKRRDPLLDGQDAGAASAVAPLTPQWPVQATVSSGFGVRRDPINGERRFHYGIDLAAEEGTTVRAAMPGRVIVSEQQENYGNVVVLDHGHGLTTLYAHNRENLVREGDWVKDGAPLARLGSSGRSTGPHLHFEVRRNGTHLDPAAFMGPVPDNG